jgi:hypothetical protein
MSEKRRMPAFATGTPRYEEIASAKGLLELPPMMIIRVFFRKMKN